MDTKNTFAKIFLLGFKTSGNGFNGFHCERMSDEEIFAFIAEDFEKAMEDINNQLNNLKIMNFKFAGFKINCSEIDKDLLFKGEKGTYLSGYIVETPGNEFNDFMIVQGLSKADKKFNEDLKKTSGYDKKDLKQGKILGNIKILEMASELTDEEKYDLPF